MDKNKIHLDIVKDEYKEALESNDIYSKKIGARVTIISILFSGLILLLKSYLDDKIHPYSHIAFNILVIISIVLLVNILITLAPILCERISINDILNNTKLSDFSNSSTDDSNENIEASLIVSYIYLINKIDKKNAIRRKILIISSILLVISLVLFIVFMILLF